MIHQCLVAKPIIGIGLPHGPAKYQGISMNYKIGIAIAIIFVIIAGVMVYIFVGPASVGQPTYHTMANGFMKPIKINASISGLTPAHSGSGAGKLYILAYKQVEALSNNRNAIKDLTANANPDASPEIQAIVKLIEQAAPATMSRKYLFFAKGIRLPKASDTLADRLNAIGQMTGAYAASCISDKKQKEAINALTGLLVFGHRLWQRGLFVDVRTCGLADIQSAAAGLRMLYKSGPTKNQYEYAAATKLLGAVNAASTQWYGKMKIVDVLNPQSGDMANIVRYDQDISWRIEALLELGIARWNTSYAPRAHAIAVFLKHYTADSNHWISASAKVAYSMTADTMNQLAAN